MRVRQLTVNPEPPQSAPDRVKLSSSPSAPVSQSFCELGVCDSLALSNAAWGRKLPFGFTQG